MRPLVMFVRIAVNSNHRSEIGDFMAWAVSWQMQNPDKIRDLLIVPPIRGVVPTTCARNLAVKMAREKHADVLFMVDDDMVPQPKFFASAVEFLGKHHGPAAIGVPYCCGGVQEDVMVFQWASGQSQTPSAYWRIARIPREDAARRTGIERVPNLGTGLIAYTMDCFDAYEPPYFDYRYNSDYTAVIETDDCYCHRLLATRGIPLYCDWSNWAGHEKPKIVPKPEVVEQSTIDQYYVRQARAELTASILVPRDIEGFRTDMGDVYLHAVNAALEPPSQSRFVEVGCWKGASTIMLANIVRQSGKSIKIVAVDTFCGSPDEQYHREAVREAGGSVRPEFEANLRKHNVADLIETMEMESVKAADKFAAHSCEFVYLDAQHTYEAVKADIGAWFGKVIPGGILAGHDIDFPGVRKAVEELLPEFTVVGHSWLWKKPAASALPVGTPMSENQAKFEQFLATAQ